MNRTHKTLIGMAASLALVLGACEDSTEKSKVSANSDSQQEETQAAKNTNTVEKEKKTTSGKTSDQSSAETSDQSSAESNEQSNEQTSDQTSDQTKEQTEKQTDQQEKQSTAANTVSLKDDYLKKLNKIKKDTEYMRDHSSDESTYGYREVESEVYKIRDGMLNEIYHVLIDQLPSNEMDKVRKEQRAWLIYRDKTAKKAGEKYKGGTLEPLEYSATINNLTLDRSFELVKKYMK